MLGGPTEDAVKVNWPLAILASVAIHVVFVGALLFFSRSGDTAPAKTQEASAQPSTQTPEPAVEQEPAPPPVQPAQSSPRTSRGTRGSNGGRSSGGTRNAGSSRGSGSSRTSPAPSTSATPPRAHPTPAAPSTPRANAGANTAEARPAPAAPPANATTPVATAATPPALAQPAASEVEFYTVRPGDSLTKIAKREGCSVAELAKLNGFSTDKMLNVGQRIKLPKAER